MTCTKLNLLRQSSKLRSQRWTVAPNELVHIDICVNLIRVQLVMMDQDIF